MNGVVNAAVSIPLPTVSTIYDNMSEIYLAGVIPPPNATGVPDLPDLTDYVTLSSLGIQGDGTDEAGALRTILQSGGKYIVDGLNVRIDSQITSTAPLYLVGLNGARIYSGNTSSNFPNAMINAKDYISCYGLELDGSDTMEQGIVFEKSCYIVNNHIHHFRTNENCAPEGVYATAAGVQGNPGTGSYTQIIEWNTIKDVTGYWYLRTDGTVEVGNGKGGSRAVMIRNNSNSTVLDVSIQHNTFENIFGEEGDDVFIFDHDHGTRTSSYEVAYNTMTNVHRRAVKYLCYDVKIHHNDISSLTYPNSWIVQSNVADNSWNVTAPISCSGGGYAGAEIYENTIDYTSIANSFFNTSDHDDLYIHDNHLKFRTQAGSPGEPALVVFDNIPSNTRIENNIVDSDSQYLGIRAYSGVNTADAVFSGNSFVIHSADQEFYYPGTSLPNATFSENIAIDTSDIYSGGAPLTVEVSGPAVTSMLHSTYQEPIGTIPAYDPNDNDHVLIPDATQLYLLNTSPAHYFYLTPGVDYTVQGRFTLTNSGTAEARKYVLLNDGATTHPGALPETAQANLPLTLSGADYWTFHRVSNLHYTFSSVPDINNTYRMLVFINTASDNIFSMCNISDFDLGIIFEENCHRNTIQHCRIADQSYLGRLKDIPAISLAGIPGGDGHVYDTVLVGNEISNTVDGIQLIDYNNTRYKDYQGTIIDNNNIWIDDTIYVTPLTALAENAMDFKAGSENSENPLVITNNKMWGWRKNSQGSGPGATTVFHYDVKNVVFEDNVMFDSHRGFACNSGNALQNATIKRNIVYECDKTDETRYAFYVYDSTDVDISDNVFTQTDSGNGSLIQNSAGIKYDRNIHIDNANAGINTTSLTSAVSNHYYNTNHTSSLTGTDYDVDPMMSDLVIDYDVYTDDPKQKTLVGVVTTPQSPHYTG